MGSTIRNAAITVVGLASTLAVGTAGSDARGPSFIPSPCLIEHHGAVRYCQAHEQRVAIRTLREMQAVERHRAHVEFRVARRLGWNVARLKRANRWERARLRGLRALPSYTYVRMPGSWTCIHGHEGAWNDSGDPYWGGLQMDRGFMNHYGADFIRIHHGGLANVWTPHEQMVAAERAYFSGRGFGPWPQTRRMCGV